mmetsp:Transcript_44702/g.85462  ORF Transcript_44702/g.85462 Transcript_44702/m.85462 type:complete len:263 (-) Transcript_44702:187-975(-)
MMLLRRFSRSCVSSSCAVFGAGDAGSVAAVASATLRREISVRRSAMICAYSAMWESMLVTFACTLSWMFLARLAYLRVLRDSSRQCLAGEMLAIMVVRQLPPKESLSRRVSLESRNGTYAPLPPTARSPRALMQFPSASKERLMLAPSIMRMPWFLVLAARSEPAKSIRLSLATRTGVEVSGVRSVRCTVTCRTAWERDEKALAAVGSCVRWRLPLRSSSMISLAEVTSQSLMPATHIPFTGSSRRSRYTDSGESKSRMFSL